VKSSSSSSCLVVAVLAALVAATGCGSTGGAGPGARTGAPSGVAARAQPGLDVPPPPRPAGSVDDISYYRERCQALAGGVATEIARTDFVQMRRGRLYLRGPVESRAMGALHAKMSQAFEKGDAPQVIDATTQILAEDQADIRAHMMRSMALRASKASTEAEFHHQVAQALVESILIGGDGHGFDSAWTVYRTSEEYEFLMTRGFVVVSQSLQEHAGRHFDVLRAREVRGEHTADTSDIYFDVTEVFAEEGRQFMSK
jgi:hypothetical protein